MVQNSFSRGVRDGIPIALGYVSVSFTFGMMAVSQGLPVWFAVAVSMTNLTSAGQFAGLSLIVSGASLLEMALTQLTINLRYAFSDAKAGSLRYPGGQALDLVRQYG